MPKVIGGVVGGGGKRKRLEMQRYIQRLLLRVRSLLSDTIKRIETSEELSLADECVDQFQSRLGVIPRDMLRKWITYEMRFRSPLWSDRGALVVLATQLTVPVVGMIMSYCCRTPEDLRVRVSELVNEMQSEFRLHSLAVCYEQTVFPCTEDHVTSYELVQDMMRLYVELDSDTRLVHTTLVKKVLSLDNFVSVGGSGSDKKEDLAYIAARASHIIVHWTPQNAAYNASLPRDFSAFRYVYNKQIDHEATIALQLMPLRLDQFARSMQMFRIDFFRQKEHLTAWATRHHRIQQQRRQLKKTLAIQHIYDDATYPSKDANDTHVLPWAHDLYASWIADQEARASTRQTEPQDAKETLPPPNASLDEKMPIATASESSLLYLTPVVPREYDLRLVNDETIVVPRFDGSGLILVSAKTRWSDLTAYLALEGARVHATCCLVEGGYRQLRDLLEDSFFVRFPRISVSRNTQMAWYNRSAKVRDIISTYETLLKHHTQLSEVLWCFAPLPASGETIVPTNILVVPNESATSLGYKLQDHDTIIIPANLTADDFDPQEFAQRITQLVPHLRKTETQVDTQTLELDQKQ